MRILTAPIAALCLFAVALGGCAQLKSLSSNADGLNLAIAATTSGVAAANPKAAKALTKVNTTITNASTKVSAYIPVISAVVNADCLVGSALSSKAALACTAAKSVISAYNSGAAPTDPVSLAAFFERAVTGLASAGVI